MSITSASASPRIGAIVPQNTPLLQIPSDPLILIFQRVNGVDIDALILSCRRLYSIFENDMTWKHLFLARFPLDNSPDINNYKAAYQARHKEQYLKFKEAFELLNVRINVYNKLKGNDILALGLSSRNFHSCIQNGIDGDTRESRLLAQKLTIFNLWVEREANPGSVLPSISLVTLLALTAKDPSDQH
jgi:hypothetical protein